jgi:hypothetical protein
MSGDPVEINPSVGAGYRVMSVDEWAGRFKRSEEFSDCLACGGNNTKEHAFSQVSKGSACHVGAASNFRAVQQYPEGDAILLGTGLRSQVSDLPGPGPGTYCRSGQTDQSSLGHSGGFVESWACPCPPAKSANDVIIVITWSKPHALLVLVLLLVLLLLTADSCKSTSQAQTCKRPQ